MPENYDYSEPARLLSRIRLSSYKTSLTTQTDAQLFGAYCWNLAVVGAFYPLIQLVEVALRNALHHVAYSKYAAKEGNYWFNLIPSRQQQDDTGRLVVAEQTRKFQDSIKNAKRNAKKNLEKKGVLQPKPTVDQIISQCDFATWEYLLDKHFYNGSDKNYLWPHELTKVFRKLPKVQETKNVMFHQRDAIRRRIETIRSFRNRISHNEPAWTLGSVGNKQDVVDKLIEKLNDMMELLYWISPKFKKYVVDIGIDSRIRQILSIRELDRYMHSYKRYDINDLQQMSDLLSASNANNYRYFFTIKGIPGILSPSTSTLLQ
ncbi:MULTISPECIES: Abi family protein [Enterobacteriaceae]|uniref:Abi family protein n=1 Tax=Enterobacteriaceae TaxID=543 RepID=UPI0028ABFFD7|nr:MULTISPECIES: Abi family protein [Enterobacteriaceae]